MSYEDHYRHHHERSRILTGTGDGDQFHGVAPNLSSLGAVKAELAAHERPGDEAHGIEPGPLAAAEAEVEAAQARIDEHARQQRLTGLDKKVAPPDKLQDELERAQAKRDVCREEAEELRRVRESFIEEANSERARRIRKHIGTMKMNTEFDPSTGKRRTAVDHQCLALADRATGEVIDDTFNPRDRQHLNKAPSDSIIVIDDAVSEYDGMSLTMYERVCRDLKRMRSQKSKEWVEANRQLPPDEREPESRISARASRFKGAEWPPAWPTGSTNFKAKREAVRSSPARDLPEADDTADAAIERRREAKAKGM